MESALKKLSAAMMAIALSGLLGLVAWALVKVL